jgi:hypothetical protein
LLLLVFQVTNIGGTGALQLAHMLKAARAAAAVPRWPTDVVGGLGCAKCGEVRTVEVLSTGPISARYFNFGGSDEIHAPYTMPTRFPNVLLEVLCERQSPCLLSPIV